METQTLIHLCGKIVFKSPTHATETQQMLLSNGFRYFAGSQQPRPNAYGVMCRQGEIRTAANQHSFKAYGVPLVDRLELPPRQDGVERKPRPVPMTRDQRVAVANRAHRRHIELVEERVMKLVSVVLVALKNIKGYEANLYGTNSRSEARRVAWEKLYRECVKVNGSVPQEGTLRTAIRRVLSEKGKAFMIPDSRRTTKAMRGI